MAKITDPARELVGTLKKLQVQTNASGSAFLADQFGVEVWSRDFYRIIFCLLDRIEEVKNQIEVLDMYDDEKANAVEHCNALKRAFSQQSLNGHWASNGLKHISGEHVGALQMLSPQIRMKTSFNVPSQEELSEILAEANKLKVWLEEHQL